MISSRPAIIASMRGYSFELSGSEGRNCPRRPDDRAQSRPDIGQGGQRTGQRGDKIVPLRPHGQRGQPQDPGKGRS